MLYVIETKDEDKPIGSAVYVSSVRDVFVVNDDAFDSSVAIATEKSVFSVTVVVVTRSPLDLAFMFSDGRGICRETSFDKSLVAV